MSSTHIDALDQLFGTIDELTSDQQTPPDDYAEYIYQPEKHTDRSRHLHSLLDKVQRHIPGTQIIDTEFISSGYATLLLPNAGPYKDIELRVQPVFESDSFYEFFVHWGGFSEIIYRHSIHGADIGLHSQLQEYLGTLWSRCYNGLCIYEGWEPVKHIFPTYSCKMKREEEEEEDGTINLRISNPISPIFSDYFNVAAVDPNNFSIGFELDADGSITPLTLRGISSTAIQFQSVSEDDCLI